MTSLPKKRCSKCNLPKTLDQFGKDRSRKDGLFQWCIRCQTLHDKEYRANNKEKHAAQSRLWRANNRVKARDIQNRSTVKHRKDHADKVHARSIVSHAIRDGKLIRKPCEVCEDPKSQAHHDDYSKPLEVKWLCLKHHKQADKLKKEKP